MRWVPDSVNLIEELRDSGIIKAIPTNTLYSLATIFSLQELGGVWQY
jgi:hypothetical protein